MTWEDVQVLGLGIAGVAVVVATLLARHRRLARRTVSLPPSLASGAFVDWSLTPSVAWEIMDRDGQVCGRASRRSDLHGGRPSTRPDATGRRLRTREEIADELRARRRETAARGRQQEAPAPASKPAQPARNR